MMIPLTDEMRGAYLQWHKDHVLLNRSQYGPEGSKRRVEKETEFYGRQRALAAMVRRGPAKFASHLREVLGIPADAPIGAPVLPRKLTSSEFRDPCLELEIELAEALSELRPFEATQPLFWTVCHIQWMEAGQLDQNTSDWLLGRTATGKPEKEIDRAMRNVMRRLGGLHIERGKVSVLSDCPIARAWWRSRIACEVSGNQNPNLTSAEAHTILHANSQAWETLVGRSVKRLTAINHPQVRAAILSQLGSVHRTASKIDGKALSAVMAAVSQALAQFGVTHSLPHQPTDVLAGVVKQAMSDASD